MRYALIYVLVMTVIGFGSMAIDKLKAKAGAWRIPEATLFIIAALGGSIGSIIGMRTLRHKTKHRSFTLGLPAILILQIVIAVIAAYFFL